MAYLTYAAGSIGLLTFTLWYYLHVPSTLPRSIPSVPIYVSLVALWSNMGQDEVYEKWLREPLERYGAVKIWFAGQWSILVTQPDYLADMFRNEHIFAKAGSQVKIPWSVIASLVGDNIINTHDNWSKFTKVMKPAMQKRAWDLTPMLEETNTMIDIFLGEQATSPRGAGLPVNPLIQRWAIQIMARSYMRTDLNCLHNPNVRLENLQTIIKRTLFKPLFFNFPALDKYSAVFRSRKAAYSIMQEFGDKLFELGRSVPRIFVDEKYIAPEGGEAQVVDLLNVALDRGIITETQYRANIKITFLTAHENAQQLLNSIFWELGKDSRVQSRLRDEVLATKCTVPSAALLNSMPYLTSVLYEMLRLYPPVSQLINRVALEDSTLGGTLHIPKRTWVGWNAYGAHVDGRNWSKPYDFEPSRWGETVEEMNSKFRRDCVAGRYIPFNAHSRKCIGQGFALLQMKVALFELVRRAQWMVDPNYKLRLTSVILFLAVVWQDQCTDGEAGRYSSSTWMQSDISEYWGSRPKGHEMREMLSLAGKAGLIMV